MQLTKKDIAERLKAFAPFRVCLGCGVGPHLKIHKSDEPFTFCCPECDFKAGPFSELQAAVTDWHRANRADGSNVDHIAEVWGMRYESQHKISYQEKIQQTRDSNECIN